MRGKVAIVGAGGASVCTALELADHGVSCDLFDQCETPVSRASRVNEGKIHLGLIYANDPSFETAKLMIRGALAFRACLSRWLGGGEDFLGFSTPFHYAVNRHTLVPLEAMERHFDACSRLLADRAAATGRDYLGLTDEPRWRRLAQQEARRIVDHPDIEAVIETDERSVDARLLAEKLTEALLAAEELNFVGNTRISGVRRRADGGFEIESEGGERFGPYNQLVNASWESRLAIDRMMGIAPPPSWSFRHKLGNRVMIPLAEDAVPSVTMVLGPFGDIVNFGERGMFLSWYPTGMIGMTSALEPPRDWADVAREERMAIFDASFEQWRLYCPVLDGLDFDPEDVDPASGIIYARGETDIDDPDSLLHMRDTVGVRSFDGYHSISTGKFTLTPLFALEAAARVLGREELARDY